MVLYECRWGTVCDDRFKIKDANVVCRQLGFVAAVDYHTRATFGPGSGDIWLDNLGCRGNEPDISYCDHSGWGVHNCDHGEDVGVTCSKGVFSLYFNTRILLNNYVEWCAAREHMSF